jgi:hypothetical protein
MNPGKKRDVVIQVFDDTLLQYFMENSFPVSADSEKDFYLRSEVFLSLISEKGYLNAVIKISDDCLYNQLEKLNSNEVKNSNGISK